jgi:isoaspartyl peptidase/L-asparaginase-like protein (Ntn-hydrolase superfamily)/UDP-N-acetylmuramyl tripeptide synthase
MQFRKILALRGPNIWASYPVLEAWLDLGDYRESPSDELPGFAERLMAWLPSLIEHRCSVGERGGFLERLRRGTYQGHILEHVALELQSLVGPDVGFGRTRASHEEGVYRVAVEYENEPLGRASLEMALRICLAAIRAEPFDIHKELGELRKLAGRVLPSATTAALLRAARKRRIPVRTLRNGGLLCFGYGKNQRRLNRTQTDRTSASAEAIALDRELTFSLLRSAGLNVPKRELVADPAEGCSAAEELGFPVVVRPCQGAGRKNTSHNLHNRTQVLDAYLRAADADGQALVEKQVAGATWRLLVVGERLVSAVMLLAEVENCITPGTDVTEHVHPDVAACAVEAARVIGLDVAGVDIVAPDLRRSLEDSKGVIVGVHPRPGLKVHLQPNADPQPAAEAVLARVYPEGTNGRIPIIGVTGVNGKTTTTRMLTHILNKTYRCVGMTCTEGIYIDGRRIESGDCSGPVSASAVLHHPRVEAAVLETARGGILRAGLGFDRCDVAVVTNIGEGDHLGLNDVETPEELARVKRVLVEAVAKNGAAVLRADDPLVAGMAEHCRGSVVWFCRDGSHPLLVEHRKKNGRCAFVRDGHIILAEGEQEIPLVPLARVPLTHAGRICFQVDNALAAAAATWSLGIPCDRIRVGLETFSADLSKSPGRFNLFEINGATVVLDYGHNAYALASLIEAMKHWPQCRRVAVYSTAGDRRDCDLIRQGELLGNALDRVVLYEDHYLRGRKPGEIIRLFRQGVEMGARAREIEELRGAVPAMEHALATVRPGELLLLQADEVDESVEFIRRYLASCILPVLARTPMHNLQAPLVICLVLLIAVAGFAEEAAPRVVLVIHGGAGVRPKSEMTPKLKAEYEEGLTRALQAGHAALKRDKGTSVDAVEAAIRVLEDCPLFNAGKGAVFTNDGRNELDASIMEGKDRNAGAVAGVCVIKNPISAARAVMEKSPHVMLIGRGAERFASDAGLEIVDPSYFFTKERWEQLKKAQQEENKDRNKKGGWAPPLNRYFGTVGAVALDRNGTLAAGTSTGGMTNKRFGRIGDSPIIGAGNYAENPYCGVSCTGHGEVFIRYHVASDVVARMRYKKLGVKEAAEETLAGLPKEEGGVGGLIALDAKGNVSMPYNTEGMYRGYVTSDGKIKVMIYEEK